MSWYRAARRVVGLSSQPEYPNLEALLEAEAGQTDNGYFLAARIVPPIASTLGLAVFLPLAIIFSPLFYIGIAGFFALAAGFWFLFDFLDRSISAPKKRIRKLASLIWARYGGISNLVGVEPAISATVGHVLDDAAAIYLRHSDPTSSRKSSSDAYRRAHQALEVAMAKMLELATAPNLRSQELEFESGWALPLLQEMRQVDIALTQLAQYAANDFPVDPLANLREARAELTGVVSAIDELEQRQSH